MGGSPRDDVTMPGVLGMDESNPIKRVRKVARPQPWLLRLLRGAVQVMVVLRCPVRGPRFDNLRRKRARQRHNPFRQSTLLLVHRDVNSFVLLERQLLGRFENAVLVNGFDGDGDGKALLKHPAPGEPIIPEGSGPAHQKTWHS